MSDQIRRLLGHRAFIVGVGKTNLDGESLPFRDEDTALVPEIFRNRFSLQRGGHYHDLQIRSPRLLEPLGQGEGHVAQQIALMKFVENQDGHPR